MTMRDGSSWIVKSCSVALGLALSAGGAACDDRELIVGGWEIRPVRPGGAGGREGGVGGTVGADAGSHPGPPTAETPIAGCRAYRTLGEMDTAFFPARCGNHPVCHATGGVFGDFTTPGLFERAPRKSSITCPGTLLADPVDWSRSMLWLKVQEQPRCPNGNAAGTGMPSSMAGSSPSKLSADERACLEGYLKAIAGVR